MRNIFSNKSTCHLNQAKDEGGISFKMQFLVEARIKVTLTATEASTKRTIHKRGLTASDSCDENEWQSKQRQTI